MQEKREIKNKPSSKLSIAGYLEKITREIVAIGFWFYVFVKLFILDIDQLVVNRFAPEYAWILNLKFFILIGIIAAVWLFTKNKHVLVWFLYIVFYPVIVLFWKVPYFIFKQKSWVLAVALLNSVISFFKSLKFNFIAIAFFLISVVVILIFSSPVLLWLSILSILTILLIIYVHQFSLVFRPSSIFQVHLKIFSGIRRRGTPSFALDDEIKNLPVEKLNEKQLEKWTTNLQLSVLFNRLCLFAAKKLQDYQKSGLNVVSYVVTLLLLLIITITAFGAIFFGLYKIEGVFFNLAAKPTFFIFLYYSFNNLLFNSISEVVPVMTISRAAAMIEWFFALFLVAILVSLLISVKSQRYSDELSKVIKEIEKEGESMEGFIREEYKLKSIGEAISALEKLKASLVNFIYQITKNIE